MDKKQDITGINDPLSKMHELSRSNPLIDNIIMVRKSELAAGIKRASKQNVQQSTNEPHQLRDFTQEDEEDENFNHFDTSTKVTLQPLHLMDDSVNNRRQRNQLVNLQLLQTLKDRFLPRSINALNVNAETNQLHFTSSSQDELIPVDPFALGIQSLDVHINAILSKHNLNSEQEIVYRYGVHALTHPDDQCNMIITGDAGTGKSRIINSLQELATTCKINDLFQITASTGTSGSKLLAPTIHSFLCLSFNNKRKSSQASNKKKNANKITSMRLLIVDEYSMISTSVLQDIHYRLCQARQQGDKPFGGYSVFFLVIFSSSHPSKVFHYMTYSLCLVKPLHYGVLFHTV